MLLIRRDQFMVSKKSKVNIDGAVPSAGISRPLNLYGMPYHSTSATPRLPPPRVATSVRKRRWESFHRAP